MCMKLIASTCKSNISEFFCRNWVTMFNFKMFFHINHIVFQHIILKTQLCAWRGILHKPESQHCHMLFTLLHVPTSQTRKLAFQIGSHSMNGLYLFCQADKRYQPCPGCTAAPTWSLPHHRPSPYLNTSLTEISTQQQLPLLIRAYPRIWKNIRSGACLR